MSQKSSQVPEWTTASPELYTAYTDFILSRHTVCRSKRTIIWYEETLTAVVEAFPRCNAVPGRRCGAFCQRQTGRSARPRR